MTVSDARALAWIAAHDILKNAQKTAIDKGRLVEPIPEWYWAQLAQADVWARLALVDGATACIVGSYVEERAQAEERQKSRIEEMLAKRKPDLPSEGL